MNSFADTLRSLRLARRLGQVAAARLCGVSLRTYARWENGESEPRGAERAGVLYLLRKSK